MALQSKVLGAWLITFALYAQDGIVPIIGGLPQDSGLALGLEYRKSRLGGGPADFRARMIGSTKRYEYLELQLAFPRLASRWLFSEWGVRYRNYPEEDFWGIGLKSSQDRRTTFRLEDIDYTTAFGIRPLRVLRAGLEAGFLNVNTGPGKDEDYPSIEQIFVPLEAPALDRQPHFQHVGAFVELDYRDQPSDPSRGGYYLLRWTRFHDRTLGHFHFRRWDIHARQFFPSFRPIDTVAVRFKAALSQKQAGRQIPFFLQPTVGGGNDLRGYRQYRFRDENMLVMNLEYRARMAEFLQVVGFADAGRVFARPGQIRLTGARASLGGGMRLTLGSLVLGIDAGWSPEGLRVWFRGSQVF